MVLWLVVGLGEAIALGRGCVVEWPQFLKLCLSRDEERALGLG